MQGKESGAMEGSIGRAEAVSGVSGRMVATRHGRVHLVEQGPRDGTAIVLLHGASGNLRDWRISLMPALPRSWRVIAVDRPGFGHSDPAPGQGWRLGPQGETIRAALSRIGAERVILVGHSWSGALVLDWALRHPGEVAGIHVLSGATMDWGGRLGPHYQLIAAPGIGRVVASIVPHLVTRRLVESQLSEIFAPQPVPPGYAERGGVNLALRPHTFRTNAQALTDLHSQIRANQPRYPEIRCPVEIQHGTEDRLVPAEIHAEPLARMLPEARLEFLEGIGHMPHHAVPERVRAALVRLRGRVDPAG
jgi:pimeloyl-ACP methyl ester carboxylesterase